MKSRALGYRIAGLLTRRGSIRLRLGLLPISCLALQAAIISGPGGFGEAEVARRTLFPVSYLGLLAFVWLNRWSLGLLVVGLGVALNFLAIASNSGLMPVAPDTLARAGLLEEAAGLAGGDSLPRSKDVILERGETRLWPLTDIFVLENPSRMRVFSLGDLVIAFGLLATAGEGAYFLFWRRGRSAAAQPGDRGWRRR